MASKIEFVLLEKFQAAHKKHSFELEGDVPAIIKDADVGDTLAINISVNSPIKIIKAVNISKNPTQLFNVAAP